MRVESMLRSKGFSVGGLHGDMSQSGRMEALQNFKTGKTGLLVATDVAARGLDIPNVAAVINYTFPLTIEDYIHRIGRTGKQLFSNGIQTTLTVICRPWRQERQVYYILHRRRPREGPRRRTCEGAPRERFRYGAVEKVPDDYQEEDAQRVRSLLPRRYPYPFGSDEDKIRLDCRFCSLSLSHLRAHVSILECARYL